MPDYQTIRGISTFEYEEKRSRFIASAAFAGVEGMALAENFNADLRLGIAGMDHVAACAGNGAIHIVGMNTLLHFHFTSFSIMTKGSHT